MGKREYFGYMNGQKDHQILLIEISNVWPATVLSSQKNSTKSCYSRLELI
jgi:hypothetical protein